MVLKQCHNGTMNLQTRIPDLLHAEAASYARSVGISLNGLLLVALRDYLDGRRATLPSGGLSPSVATAELAKTATGAAAEVEVSPIAVALDVVQTRPAAGAAVRKFKAPKSRADPCPCGARDQRGFRLKWRQCHGKEE